jgi:hypothetical protein
MATPHEDDPVMLTLAALTYRGFQDALPGDPHDSIVRRAIQDGLDNFAPVKKRWELVWGPVTSRLPIAVFDSNAMYVVQSVEAPNRYVVAIRGTNPVASTDWLFGDLLVDTTVPWPYPAGDAAVSGSTALGLEMIQDMRWRPRPIDTRGAQVSRIGSAVDRVILAGRARLSGVDPAGAAGLSSIEAQVGKIVQHWQDIDADRPSLAAALRALCPTPQEIRPKLLPEAARAEAVDLMTFLAMRASRNPTSPLEVIVTGHSKGGALAPAVALWLKEALHSRLDDECWDPTRRAVVRCHAFAGPTPGNEAFAARIDGVLGEDHHHLRNMNDVVTHAWQTDELRQIPALYGGRTAPFGALIGRLAAGIAPLNYRQARKGVVEFSGALAAARPFPGEFIHQHLDAYLEELRLAPALNALKFFI